LAVSENLFISDDMIETAVFKVMDTACFLWHHMDDAHIIYDVRSGHSQALNDFAYEIFEILADKPCDLAGVIAELERILEQPLGEALKSQVKKTIIDFDKMGLIEPKNPEHRE
jgi:PqqD family protein of HPr-rel-A system